ncbi:MAG: sigma 54-interacting transcriptional regulator [Deltaproteobacteria bacterium]|nr:sigma 54-interacting transcriptional regulator [Deltaproteobacteria bacterium]
MAGTLTEPGTVHAPPGRCPRLTLFLSAERPYAPPRVVPLGAFDELRIGRGDGERASRSDAGAVLEIGLDDARLSTDHARLTRIGGRWLLEDRGSKNGTRVGGLRETRVFLGDGDVVEMGRSFFVFRRDADDVEVASPGGARVPGLETVVPSLAAAFDRLAAIARSDVPIVLRGESGAGKEVVARAVHALSGRSGRLVAVNCGALPEALVASELFGHRRGAFTGANNDRAGFVRSADRGTLLLDEIADLPASSQASLLRVLQEHEVTPVGAALPVPVDVRVVTATRRDLESLVASGAFREDLWARLSGFVLHLPPLRDRREDLGLVVASLLERARPHAAGTVTLSVEAARALCLHGWPRNVRELAHAIESALALAADGHIELHHLPPAVAAAATPTPVREDEDSSDGEAMARRDELTALIRRHGGNLSAVARDLRKDRKQIQRGQAAGDRSG